MLGFHGVMIEEEEEEEEVSDTTLNSIYEPILLYGALCTPRMDDSHSYMLSHYKLFN